MDTVKNYQSIVDFYHNKPHQYKSLTSILKLAVEHNTWNITHNVQQYQVQVVAWPCCW